MSLIDIGALKNAAAKIINDEAYKKAEAALLKQMRAVQAAEAVLRAEKLKLADIEAQISEGTL